MARIPIGRKYISTVSGTVLKYVHCSHCQYTFTYLMKREAKGDATSWLFLNNRGAAIKAQENATQSLEFKLRTEIDAVRCQNCGIYQTNMVNKLEKEAWNRVYRTGLWFGLIGAGLAVFGIGVFPQAPPIVFILFAIILWVWRVSLDAKKAINFDPNKSVVNIAELKSPENNISESARPGRNLPASGTHEIGASEGNPKWRQSIDWIIGVVMVIIIFAGIFAISSTMSPPTADAMMPTSTIKPVLSLPKATIRPTSTYAPATPTPMFGMCAKVSLRIRSGPGTEYSMIDGLAVGECFKVVGRNQESTWVYLGNGAWVIADPTMIDLKPNTISKLPVYSGKP